MKPTSLASPSAQHGTFAGHTLRQRLEQGYVLVSGLLALAILAQVFLAGGGLLAGAGWLPAHRMLGMMLSLGPLLLLAVGIAARLPGRILWLTGLALALVVVQPLLISMPEQVQLPTLKALHVVNALLIFALTLFLGQQTWRRLRPAPTR